MFRRFLFVATLVAVVVSACAGPAAPAATPQSAAAAQASKDATGNVAPKAAAGSIAISGAGATFPFPLYSRWFYDYSTVDSGVKFNYQSIGSGGGIQQITAKTVDFGASDAILNESQLKAAPGIQMLPAVAGAVVPVINVKELNGVKDGILLDGATLADIFLGKIKKWNDPAIARLNSAPGVALPEKDILVVHRSDGSGTTFIFADYLSAVSDEWKTKVGKNTSVQWPVGLGGKGNEGVAGTVSQNDGSIGYVELAYAHQNKMAIVRMVNAAGAPVVASIESTQKAMADFGGDMPDTLARSVVNAPGKDSWPIAGYTYLLVYMDQQDCAKAQKVVAFIEWALKDGSKQAAELEYVPLPDAVRSKVLAKVDAMTCQGKALSQ